MSIDWLAIFYLNQLSEQKLSVLASENLEICSISLVHDSMIHSVQTTFYWKLLLASNLRFAKSFYFFLIKENRKIAVIYLLNDWIIQETKNWYLSHLDSKIILWVHSSLFHSKCSLLLWFGDHKVFSFHNQVKLPTNQPSMKHCHCLYCNHFRLKIIQNLKIDCSVDILPNY